MNVSKQGSFDKNGRSKFKGGMSTLATARDEECSDYDDDYAMIMMSLSDTGTI
jgi:hypothetical protein